MHPGAEKPLIQHAVKERFAVSRLCVARVHVHSWVVYAAGNIVVQAAFEMLLQTD